MAEITFKPQEVEAEQPSFQSFAAAIMLEFICSNPLLVEKFRPLFQKRVNAYMSNKLDGLHYVISMTDLADDKLVAL